MVSHSILTARLLIYELGKPAKGSWDEHLERNLIQELWKTEGEKSTGTDNCSIYLNSNLIVRSTFIFAFPSFSMNDSEILKGAFFVQSNTHRLYFYCIY